MIEYEEIAVLDRNAMYLGVPTIKLMENAGSETAQVVLDRIKSQKLEPTVLILCGLGNNGGDGLVAARYIAYEHNNYVQVLLTGQKQEIKSQLALEQYNRLPERVDINCLDANDKSCMKVLKDLDMSAYSVIIDSMLGVGITGTLKEPYSSIVDIINLAKKNRGTKKKKTKKPRPLVVSVDVPTGLGTGTAVKPDITVTFHDTKSGMNNSNSGEILIRDIGIPPEAVEYVGPGELTFIPKLKPTAHKGDSGKLLVIGGGPYTGAPALVGLAALRTGVDLVHIATPERVSATVASYSPNLIVHPLGSGISNLNELVVNDILDLISKYAIDAIVLGPGLGRARDTQNAVGVLLERLPKELPIMLDADTFSAISSIGPVNCSKFFKQHMGVLTPHKGELKLLVQALPNNIVRNSKRLLQQLDQLRSYHHKKFLATLSNMSKNLGSNWTMILKGAEDIITDGNQLKINRTGNAGMTVGGTGDVLAGIAGGLLAMGVTPFRSAKCAAFINGYVGDLAWKKYKNGLLATDIIDLIPQIFNEFVY